MNDLPANLFTNPAWHALRTKHRHLAVTAGDACRYPADVCPFAAVAAPEPEAMRQLQSLLALGESVWLVGENYPLVPGLVGKGTLECLQMVLPEEVVPREGVASPGPSSEIVSLSAANADEMVALTDLAFPGFFRRRTYEMGSYYGVRSEGELIAMGGERLMLEGYSEISGVCTHPAHRGKGLAANLIRRLAQKHRGDGVVSWLHVTASNTHAIELYLRLGFREARKVMLTRISRSS